VFLSFAVSRFFRWKKFGVVGHKMSEEADEVCASCGVAAVDEIKLKDCDGGCGHIVKYCSDACQDDHKEQHEEACRKSRAELRDKDLFEQPDCSNLGECPLCCLPLPLDQSKCTMMECCSKFICMGCIYANQIREIEAGLKRRCAFCREPFTKSQEEADKRMMKRVKKNDPAAMCHMGETHFNKGDYECAFEYWTKAAELGNAGAHYNLSNLYYNGIGVEKDMKKAVYHSEQAAIGGHPIARHNIGVCELNNDRFERAKKHFIIAANLEYHDSLNELMTLYANGHASKEEYANALRAYQVAVEATKSLQRDVAEAHYEAKDAAQQS
jgi:tetratricopeptide (TPR) repeat protein